MHVAPCQLMHKCCLWCFVASHGVSCILLQYTRYAPSCKLPVMAVLADSCELASLKGDEMLERAAEFRQGLFVEMIINH